MGVKMPKEDLGFLKEGFLNMLEFRGVDRRDFFKFCTATAAFLGLSDMWVPKIATAIEKAAKKPKLVWLSFSCDTGCSESLLKSDNPDAAKIVLDIVSLEFNESVSAAAGDQAEEHLKKVYGEGGYILVVEGSIPDKPGYGRIAGKEMKDIMKEAAKNAKAIIAVGSCATWGGVQAGGLSAETKNPSGAKSVKDTLGGSAAVINLDCCPVPSRVLSDLLTYFLLFEKVPELDQYGRPVMFYGQTIHNNCERRGHFEAGEFVEELGDDGEQNRFCLYKVGCKGPQTSALCPIWRYNDSVSWCVRAGGPCIGCAEPGWVDKFAGFYNKLPNVSVPGFAGAEATADKIAVAGAVAVGAGIAIHAVGSAFAGKKDGGDR